MCRIAGIISNSRPTRELSEKVKLMCNSMAHGGPDDEGLYRSDEHGLVLGHRRLAIIELSAKGHQPMPDQTARVWISFNGEIYNYLELRSELLDHGVTFRSDTDTEVIIQSYKFWGTKSFGKLRGMFAFALFDSDTAITYLVRDSAGIKPLYYHISDIGLTFSSEVRAFKDAEVATAEDPDWQIRFLAFGHIPEPYTTLKDVVSLPKSHFLSWHHFEHRYKITLYDLDHLPTATANDTANAKQLIHDQLKHTLKRQMLSDAPLGIFLSGGVDSSLLTLLAESYNNKDLRTVSIYFDESSFNEREFQNIITQHAKSENFAHLVTSEEMRSALPDLMSDMDMPTTDGLNSWFISRYARMDGLKAVLSGIGADELFGGYPSFKRVKYLKYLRKLPAPMLKLIGSVSSGRLKRISLLAKKHPLADYLFLRGIFSLDDIADILNLSKKKVDAVLFGKPLDMRQLSDQETAAWFETNIYMQNQLLRDTDVMSMAHGLEVRVPFLDEDLVHLVNNIKPNIRFNDKQPKKLLIDSFPGLLPREIWDRNKMGFSFPLQQWMRSNKDISDPKLYSGERVKELVVDFKDKGNVHWSKVFALYQLRDNLAERTDKRRKIALLTLQTFSGTGGIQKMTRTLAKMIQQIASERNWDLKVSSGYDHGNDLNTAYINRTNFKGYGKNRSLFAVKAVVEGIKADTVILHHINLSMIGLLIKLFSKKTRVWLIAHGIEVWRPLGRVKRLLLKNCDKVICVSDFTKQKLIERHQVNAEKCVVVNNALDPLIKLPESFTRPQYLMQRYGLKSDERVVFTLTRLASSEQYKGYEHVIEAVGRLRTQFPNIRYVLSGKYDDLEFERISEVINRYGVTDHVILTGYIDEVELEDHLLLADVFVLPSKKEGFGIVFIEALACGAPVICGNEDGSLDAIKNGELGTAINADDVDELTTAIASTLARPLSHSDRKKLQTKCLEFFNADKYKMDLENLLING